MSDMKSDSRPRGHHLVLRPGVALPGIGYAGCAIVSVLAVIVVVHPGTQHSLAARWEGGQILVIGAWALYKLASNRIILHEDTMSIVGWGRIWTVSRGEVKSVLLTSEVFSLSIVLRNGTVIRPMMFLASPLGVGYFRAGMFRNAMSREDIAPQILEWNDQAGAKSSDEEPRERWHARLDLPFLLTASAVIAAEAIALTAANVW
jgi:hypothetical protein